MKNIFSKIWHLAPAEVVNLVRQRLSGVYYLPESLIDHQEFSRLAKLPRHQEGETILMGKKLYFIDAPTCGAMCHDIFVDESYKFIANKENPLIIDCGSNIGLSVIFFKLLYPKSRVIAFEPDPKAFVALQKNIASFGLTGIECHNQAVWVNDGIINFLVEGGESGKITDVANGEQIVKIEATRLRQFLETEVDFLKIDVEGAETAIIKDCADNLKNVDKLFIEYHSVSCERQSLSDILSTITNAGLRYSIKEACANLRLLLDEAPTGDFDLQLNITASRQH